MAKKDESDWEDLKIVHKRVAKLRASYGSLKFGLSATAPAEWSDALHDFVDSDEDAKEMRRNPGPSVDGDTITWEVFHNDMERAWAVLKRALEVANEKYKKLHASRAAREAELQGRLDDRDKAQKKLDDKLQTLK